MIPTLSTPEELAAQRARLDEIVARGQREAAEATAKAVEASVPTHRIESEERTCETCERPFTATVGILGALRIFARNCSACCEAYERRTNPDPSTVLQNREAAWAAICPAEYNDTDEARVIREVGENAFSRVSAWTRDRGLGIVGETSRCKTRLMLLMLRKHALAGAKIRYINAVKFADELAESYGRSATEAERWMKEIERVPLLFIDDLGKEKLTERVETFYYRCVEYRTSNRHPIFFTSNLSGALLQKRWDAAARSGDFWADRAAPTVRRLRQFCTSITV